MTVSGTLDGGPRHGKLKNCVSRDSSIRATVPCNTVSENGVDGGADQAFSNGGSHRSWYLAGFGAHKIRRAKLTAIYTLKSQCLRCMAGEHELALLKVGSTVVIYSAMCLFPSEQSKMSSQLTASFPSCPSSSMYPTSTLPVPRVCSRHFETSLGISHVHTTADIGISIFLRQRSLQAQVVIGDVSRNESSPCMSCLLGDLGFL